MPQWSKPCARISVSLAVAKTQPPRSRSARSVRYLKNDDSAAACEEGLVAGREVDHREPAHAHRDAGLEMRSIGIRPAPPHRVQHRGEDMRGCRVRRVEEAGDAAHGGGSISGLFVGRYATDGIAQTTLFCPGNGVFMITLIGTGFYHFDAAHARSDSLS